MNTIEKKAEEILRKAGIDSVPVPIEAVAHYLNLEVEAAFLGEDVSGVLVIQDGRGAIGYNALQSNVRQRFTSAHEIGHFVLHHDKQKLFIDNRATIYFRNGESALGERADEIQANQFAAALLMPKDRIIEEVAKLALDPADEEEEEEAIQVLAKKFNVSTKAMSLRLLKLGFFH